MAATPIPAHVVYTVFQYIFPPSLPLPLHLLSKPLIKRHHFLGISPTDAVSYLSWPSPQTAQVAEALESASSETLLSQPEHDVRYSAPDQETLLAHVRPHSISPLQVVFAWDVEAESWRYHDVRMLPFPEGALSSLDAVAQRSPIAQVLEFPPNEFGEVSHETGSSSPASDNYWAGYDSSGSSPTTPAPMNDTTEEDAKAEAAYWASYGTVHGSGDSTVPSPAPEKGRIRPSHDQDDLRGPDIPTDPLITHLHLRLHEHNGLLSPQLYPPRSEATESHYFSVKVDDPKDMESPAVIGKHEEYGDGHLKIITSQHPDISSEHTARVMEPLHPGKSSDRREADEGVKDAVRGIYRMWKAHTPSADVGGFMEVVKLALETL